MTETVVVSSTFNVYECVHGLDLRIYPRCYLCRPFGTVQGDYPGYGTGGNVPVICTCPPNRGDNYLGNCPIHDVHITSWTMGSVTNDPAVRVP